MRLLPLAALAALALPGCLSLPTLDTGRALGGGRGATDLVVASGLYSEVSSGGPRDPFSQDSSYEYDPVPFDLIPVLQLSQTFGVGPRTDVGVGVTSAAFLSARVKHQVVGTPASPLAVAVGAEGGGHLLAFAFGSAHVYGTAAAVASYHPSPHVAVYAAPRYTAVAFALLPEEGRPDAAWAFPSLSYGVALGAAGRFGLEVTHARSGSPRPSQVALRYRLR